MKKITLYIYILCNLVLAQTQGLPSKFAVTGFAIDHYKNGDEWYLGAEGAEKLAETMRKNIKDQYPSISFEKKIYTDNAATKKKFISSETENYNFLYYHGHGKPNHISFYDGGVWNTEKSLGKKKTYWAMFVSCNVFRNGLDQWGDPWSNQDPWFDGIHSILGFASIVWGGTLTRSCGLFNIKTCYQHSYDMEEEFAERWIKNKETIWEAFKNAVYNQLYDFGDKYSRPWYTKGVVPKIVYRYGYINGKFFDPWEEKFEKAYQGPVFRSNYKGIGSRWIEFGEPAYEEPKK